MSDFSFSGRCPGCGQRYAPDDGACCMQCERCGGWHDQQLRAVIPAKNLTKNYMRRDRAGRPRPKSIWICETCFIGDDVDADHWYEEQFARERAAEGDPVPRTPEATAALDPAAIKHAWLDGADLEDVTGEQPDELDWPLPVKEVL